MVQTNTNIDYVNTSFQYPVLTKVHDTPTYEVLKRIKDEMSRDEMMSHSCPTADCSTRASDTRRTAVGRPMAVG